MNKDVFDILGINGREDSYTNLIYSIFTESEQFRVNLARYFFNSDNASKLQMIIRSSYNTPKGLSKKIVPDIILFDDKHLIIIEVKLFSDEGWKQLLRYSDAVDIIVNNINDINKYNINSKESKIYFLTLDKKDIKDDDAIYYKDVVSITWEDISKLFPNENDIKNEYLKICLKNFNSRIKEYYHNDIIYNDNSLFNDVFQAYHFVGYDKILSQMFIGNQYNIWQDWNSGQNTFSATIQYYKLESWKSNISIQFQKIDEETEIVLNKDELSAYNNYDIHYEIQFYWDNQIGKWKINLRIDYHTNPYLTKKDIKYYDLGFIYEQRKDIINKLKNKIETIDHEIYLKMPKSIKGDLLQVYTNEYVVNDEKICDIKNWIYNEIKNTNIVIENLFCIIKN